MHNKQKKNVGTIAMYIRKVVQTGSTSDYTQQANNTCTIAMYQRKVAQTRSTSDYAQ